MAVFSSTVTAVEDLLFAGSESIDLLLVRFKRSIFFELEPSIEAEFHQVILNAFRDITKEPTKTFLAVIDPIIFSLFESNTVEFPQAR